MAADQEACDELAFYTLGRRSPEFVHQHVVDATAAHQADAGTSPLKLTFALVGLYLHVERGFTGRAVQLAHMELARDKRPGKPPWPSFALPATRGTITPAQVLAAPPGAERDAAIDAWCASLWQAYGASRGRVIDLIDASAVMQRVQPKAMIGEGRGMPGG